MKRPAKIALGSLTLAIVAVGILVTTRHTITLTVADIQSALQSKFPVEKSQLIFTAKFSDPTAAIDPSTGQVTIGLKTLVTTLGRKSASGDGTATGSLRYEPKTSELFLDNPVVKLTSLELTGLAERDKPMATEIIEAGLRECFKRMPIYKLDDKDSNMLLAHRLLKSIKTENGALKIELGL